MDNSWVFDLETHIFSIVQKKVGDKLKSKYPNIRFTTTSKPKGVTVKYPTVYIRELPGAEKARTLDGEDISGILYSMQVDVYKRQVEMGCTFRNAMSIHGRALQEFEKLFGSYYL